LLAAIPNPNQSRPAGSKSWFTPPLFTLSAIGGDNTMSALHPPQEFAAYVEHSAPRA
jgi:hypothetical protein